MIIETANLDHLGSWSLLRHALWPNMSAEEHKRDIQSAFFDEANPTAAFLAIVNGQLVGFAEASVRRDYVNGCETSPVAFLEGIYVAPANRRRGVANALTSSVEEWGRSQGCLEFASDTTPGNEASQRLHAALGFEETERVIFYRKIIGK